MVIEHLFDGLFERPTSAESLQSQCKDRRGVGVDLLTAGRAVFVKLPSDLFGVQELFQQGGRLGEFLL